jgi:nicotinate-nucleotide adenylyltransferase
MMLRRNASGLPLHLPPLAPGLRIGLYGGSFNPAHAGHLHVSRLAMQRLRLDWVWWLVTPGNPLKDTRELATTAQRVASARQVARDPRIRITTVEEEIGSRYTVDTLALLRERYPAVRFVWIMGADNLLGFHRWRGWDRIAALVPIAIVDRPGFTLRPLQGRTARRFARARIPEEEAASLADREPPAWVFLHGPRSTLSSTALRRAVNSTKEEPARMSHDTQRGAATFASPLVGEVGREASG